MKVKTLSRDELEYTGERPGDIAWQPRNPDPGEHQQAAATEVTRALNAAKLGRVFAQPFVGALHGHADGVTALARSPTSVADMVTGAGDGEVRLWHIPSRSCLRRFHGHEGIVRGATVSPDGGVAVTCGDDASLKFWRLAEPPLGGLEEGEGKGRAAETRRGRHGMRGVDFGWGGDSLATAGAAVELWHPERRKPVAVLQEGADTSHAVRFNPGERNVLATCGSDRGVALHDIRQRSMLRRVILAHRPNAVAWNPREPFNFVTASEDCNLYTFDMRRLDSAMVVHRDFVSSVLDVDFSPAGTEFVAGSFDRTVRIFSRAGWQSKEVYHTKRMQRVLGARFSGDARFVVSASDEGNARVWKADPSEQLGQSLPRERRARQYRKALERRHAHVPEVRRISRQRLVPRAIHKAAQKRQAMELAQRRRRENLRRHSKPGDVPHKAARRERIVGQEE